MQLDADRGCQSAVHPAMMACSIHEAAAALVLTLNLSSSTHAARACRRGDERGGGGGGPGAGEPRSFKRFLMEDVPDSVSPVEAQALYEQYLTAHFGDQLRARFEQEKTMDRCAQRWQDADWSTVLDAMRSGWKGCQPVQLFTVCRICQLSCLHCWVHICCAHCIISSSSEHAPG